MKEWMIKTLLSWLAGITAGQWDAALEAVIVAGKRLRELPGSERKQYVIDTLRLSWPDMGSRALNLLIELAVGFVTKKGYLKV